MNSNVSRSEYLRRAWPRLKPFATFLMLAAIALVVAQYVAHNWAMVTEHRWALHWPWLLAAVLAMSTFLLCLALGWQRAITWNGTIVPWPTSLWVWSRSSLARYLPTPVWSAASRIYLTTQMGASWRGAALSYGAEIVGSLGGAFSIALLALAIWVDVSPALYILATGVATLIILPLAYLVSFRLLRRFNLRLDCGIPSLVGWSVQYALTFIVFGVANIFVLQSLATTVPPVHLIIGVSALAWGIGTLNVLSPSGLGTREIVLVYGLQDYISPPELLALSVVSRLVAVFGELLLFALVYMLNASRRALSAKVAKTPPSLEASN